MNIISICHFSVSSASFKVFASEVSYVAEPIVTYTPGYFPRLSGYKTTTPLPSPVPATYLLCPRFSPLVGAAIAAGWSPKMILVVGADAHRNPEDGSMTLGPEGLVSVEEQKDLIDAGYRTLEEIPLVPLETPVTRFVTGLHTVFSAQGIDLPPVPKELWANVVTGNLPEAPAGSAVLVPNDGAAKHYLKKGNPRLVTGVPGKAPGGKTDLFVI